MCKFAAETVGSTYISIDTGSDYPAGCYGTGGDVYFNEIVDPSKTSPGFYYRSLCIIPGTVVYILICESNIRCISSDLTFYVMLYVPLFLQTNAKEMCLEVSLAKQLSLLDCVTGANTVSSGCAYLLAAYNLSAKIRMV